MEITIKNLKESKPLEAYDVRVDRTSPLGNPFYLRSESERDLVCDKYEEWLIGQIKSNNRTICNELNRLYRLLRTHGKLNLFCWCSPKRCHAETIRTVLFRVI